MAFVGDSLAGTVGCRCTGLGRTLHWGFLTGLSELDLDVTIAALRQLQRSAGSAGTDLARVELQDTGTGWAAVEAEC